MSKFPSSLNKDIIDLMTAVTLLNQEALGHFCSNTRYAAGSIQDLSARERIQSDLDHGVGLFCAAHVFTLFEDAIPEKYWADIYDADELLQIKAYRHLRKCAANGFTGKRVTEDAADFDVVMGSPNKLPGIEHFDAASLRVSTRLGFDAVPRIQALINRAVVIVNSKP